MYAEQKPARRIELSPTDGLTQFTAVGVLQIEKVVEVAYPATWTEDHRKLFRGLVITSYAAEAVVFEEEKDGTQVIRCLVETWPPYYDTPARGRKE